MYVRRMWGWTSCDPCDVTIVTWRPNPLSKILATPMIHELHESYSDSIVTWFEQSCVKQRFWSVWCNGLWWRIEHSNLRPYWISNVICRHACCSFSTQKVLLTSKCDSLVLYIEQYLQTWMSYRGINILTRIMRTICNFATHQFHTLSCCWRPFIVKLAWPSLVGHRQSFISWEVHI